VLNVCSSTENTWPRGCPRGHALSRRRRKENRLALNQADSAARRLVHAIIRRHGSEVALLRGDTPSRTHWGCGVLFLKSRPSRGPRVFDLRLDQYYAPHLEAVKPAGPRFPPRRPWPGDLPALTDRPRSLDGKPGGARGRPRLGPALGPTGCNKPSSHITGLRRTTPPTSSRSVAPWDSERRTRPAVTPGSL